eukprot:7388234-Prymnesium_polylepis.4
MAHARRCAVVRRHRISGMRMSSSMSSKYPVPTRRADGCTGPGLRTMTPCCASGSSARIASRGRWPPSTCPTIRPSIFSRGRRATSVAIEGLVGVAGGAGGASTLERLGGIQRAGLDKSAELTGRKRLSVHVSHLPRTHLGVACVHRYSYGS